MLIIMRVDSINTFGYDDDENHPECECDDSIFAVASAGVCLYFDWESLIPYFDTLFTEMPDWPDLVALRGSPCTILSETELDMLYNSASTSQDGIDDIGRKDCFCKLCNGQTCTFYGGNTKKCLYTSEIKFEQAMDLDDPQYKYLAPDHYKDEMIKVVPHSQDQKVNGSGGLIERESSLSANSTLSSIALFWILVSISIFLSFVVGLLNFGGIRRVWNRRQRLLRAASYRTSRSSASGAGSGRPQSMMGMQDGSELDTFSLELTPILEDRPICTPFQLRN